MKILYGINATGNGHISRARIIIALIIPQPDDPNTWITQNIYGRITATGPIVNSALDYYSRLIEVEELI